jgi:hypothetical protein
MLENVLFTLLGAARLRHDDPNLVVPLLWRLLMDSQLDALAHARSNASRELRE